ncbi:hypothetical protein DY000_02021491 [Brassica cretica]|nr:hypothetical protein DY000_02021491 [Brassica cretica]
MRAVCCLIASGSDANGTLAVRDRELSWSRAEAEFVYDQERLGAGADRMKLRRERLQEQET